MAVHGATIEAVYGASIGQPTSPRRTGGISVKLGPQGYCRTLFWITALLAAFGILAGSLNVTAPVSANAAMRQGRIDVYWSRCDYFDCTCEPRTPYQRDPLELDIHADGYSLRLDRLTQIDLPRQAGSIDTTSLEFVLAIVEKRISEDVRIRIFVEAGVTMDEYIQSIDSLLSYKLDPMLILQEPPERSGTFRRMKPCSL